MRLSLRARLTLLYSSLVILTIAAFGAIAWFTVRTELYANLDASLTRAAVSLEAVIRSQLRQGKRSLTPPRRESRPPVSPRDAFEFLERRSLRDFVGPVPPLIADITTQDPVWSAVYEHMLLDGSAYLIQVRDARKGIVWRSDNLGVDSLPSSDVWTAQGAMLTDDRMITYYTIRGVRYRLLVYKGSTAEIAAAYPASEVDATLRQLFSLMVWSLPVTLLISIVAGYFLARRSLRPVDEITKSARTITAQNLSLRLPDPQTNDELARLTETLNDMIARLETSFGRIRQFTGDASHELRTPLAILMGELELALRRPMSQDAYRETLTSCLEEVERLNTVVTGLLELSRADTGHEQVNTQPVRFSTLVEDVCDDMVILADRHHITIESDIEPGIIVPGDKVRLHQAVLNVVENAVKYTEHGGMVRVDLMARDGSAMLTVTDTGIGIPADMLPKIFDRFFRVDQSRSSDVHGTGLGLSIVKWIIDMHNGTISVDSAVGKGTTFSIVLPLTSV